MHRMDVERISFWFLVNLSMCVSAEKICYDSIDVCFELDPPWATLTRLLPAPQSPEKIKPKFYLVTRRTINKSKDQWRLTCDDSYQPSPENLHELDYRSWRRGTVVLIHGMYVSPAWNWSILVKLARAHLIKENVNVIIVKHRAGANIIYTRLVANIRTVGAVTARFIKKLMELTGLEASEIHIIGHSLGGHAAGYVGKIIPNIGRITGLDIAGPFFRGADPRYRLNINDAQHIDVHHTNAGTIRFFGFGYGPPIGQVDFYYNGGKNQAGECLHSFHNVMRDFFTLKLERFFRKGYLLGACSHIKVLDYWLESLNSDNCTMWGATKSLPRLTGLEQRERLTCDSPHQDRSYAPVGLDTFDYVESGIFHVRTRTKTPYCIRSRHMKHMDLPFILSHLS